jgi:CRP-like cAMP-binding protein
MDRPFALCAPNELEELLRFFECDTYHPQTRLFDSRASNPCRALYYVLSGELRVTSLVPGAEGKPVQVVNSYFPGSFVGEQDCCGLDEMHNPNLLTCTTGTTRCVLLTLKESMLLALRKKVRELVRL